MQGGAQGEVILEIKSQKVFLMPIHENFNPRNFLAIRYYLQKMSYDVFGIVDCRNDQGYVYLVPETIGPKNTDHTLSYLYHFLCESGQVPSWISRIHLF